MRDLIRASAPIVQDGRWPRRPRLLRCARRSQSTHSCTFGEVQVAAKLASIFPALSRLEIAEALGMAGGDLHLAAEALGMAGGDLHLAAEALLSATQV